MSDRIEGRCLCGDVRYTVADKPIDVAWCHCESCRRHSGAPVSVFVAVRRAAFAVTRGEISRYNSSPGRWRGFCGRCGSTLTCEGEATSPEVHLHIGAVEHPERYVPTRHIFAAERLPWLRLSDGP